MMIEIDVEDWTAGAACRGMANETGSFDLFFEEELEAQAKRVCQGCSVRIECLGDAIAHHDWNGVRGGLNPKERESMDRRFRYWARRTDRPGSFLDWSKEVAS